VHTLEVQMTSVICLFVLVLAALAAIAAAVTGYRGLVCDSRLGYAVPPEVKDDPALCKKANDLVAFWATGFAILCAPAIVLVARVGLAGPGAELSLLQLGLLAAYGFVLACVGHYPFERIKHLGERHSVQ
jgi:hypothetical protein